MAKIGSTISATLGKAKGGAGKAAEAVKQAPGLSPNPMTNLIITDLVLRGGGRLLRNAIEKGVLGVKYPQDKAGKIVTGRSMASTLVATAAVRIATKSVPGALLVGGSLLAKTLYDRRKGHEAAKEAGQAQLERRIEAEPKL